MSPKLFTATLESIFRRLSLETRGLKIDGEYSSHLRFADDILICSNTPRELQQILHKLAEESGNLWSEYEQVDDKGDNGKRHTIFVDNTQIENVESYIYLGQRYSTRDKN